MHITGGDGIVWSNGATLLRPLPVASGSGVAASCDFDFADMDRVGTLGSGDATAPSVLIDADENAPVRF